MFARAKTVPIGTPSHRAALSRPKLRRLPFPEHSSRWTPCGSTSGSSVAIEIWTGAATSPAIVIVQGPVRVSSGAG